MKKGDAKGAPKEFEALGKVLAALAGLDATQRSWVIASAVSNLGIAAMAITPAAPAGGGGAAKLAAPIPGTPGTREHAKAFLRLKSPKSDVLRVACLGYYLAKFKDTSIIKTKQITEMNTEAAGTRITNVSQALDNATKQNHYFAPAGKRSKQLTAFGESVVEALPDMEAVAAIEKERPKRKRKATKAKKRKAA